MDWMKKHVDTVVVLGAVVGSVLWMNTEFNGITNRITQLDKEMTAQISAVDKRISDLDKEVSVIKAILIIQRILPAELASEKVEGLCASGKS